MTSPMPESSSEGTHNTIRYLERWQRCFAGLKDWTSREGERVVRSLVQSLSHLP
jgi:hypothetical protein